ncbi:hypothetical protein [Massilia eburnea]|uniref:hypothetical protein n=1 Tax=Massilia eburnea TaxID=1776165 RepID=UPI003D6AAFAD
MAIQALKPSQLTLNPATTSYTAEAGDAPLQLAVTALKPDGTIDGFAASSSNPAVLAVGVSGNTLVLTPVGAGNATVRVTCDSDPTLVRLISATIGAQFVQPTQTYTLADRASPAAAQGVSARRHWPAAGVRQHAGIGHRRHYPHLPQDGRCAGRRDQAVR